MVFGIAMDTPDGKLKLIPEIVENICSERDDVEFIRCHFSKISSYSFDFTLAYYVLSPDYHIYSTTRQIINYRIREKFGNMDIAFAYPTNEIIMIDKK
ncbi:hypothetical protein SDC9_197927 [bioreactor metagenome]|uniref:Mechanosensitive ion channel MscS C-terminal domain-containing protein n=1 Tax=bioreactor metagenome TaxID=1076179 RepID=A0A645IG62_9ZZZZ